MTRAGDLCVQCCESLRGIPKRVLCLAMVVLQGGLFNVYMYLWLGSTWLLWFLYDGLNVVLFVAAFVLSFRSMEEQRRGRFSRKTIGWLAWLILEIGVLTRMIIGLLNFVEHLREDAFFGPNTFKTTIALSAVIFVLLLTSHFEAPSGSPQRVYIEELTGTVMFDLIDTVEAIDVLFDKKARASFTDGIPVALMVIACINLLLPTIPFVTLSLTGFGQKRLSNVLVSAHKALVTVAINLPNLIVRLILWHGFSVGISVFMLKNIVLILLTTHGFYEHKLLKYKEHRLENDNRKDMALSEGQQDNAREGATGSGSTVGYNRGLSLVKSVSSEDSDPGDSGGRQSFWIEETV